MHLPRKLSFRARLQAVVAMAFVVFSNHGTLVALAAAPSATVFSVPAGQASRLACDSAVGCTQPDRPASELSLPAGLTQCPDSGLYAACASNVPAGASAGDPSVPESQAPCPDVAGKALLATPAACSDALLANGSQGTASSSPSPISPSVPVSSLGTRWASEKLDLKVDASSLRSGDKALLTATATVSVTSTNAAIEIFDQTSGTLVGACAQQSQCVVAYTSQAGLHTFRAFITQPTTRIPAAQDVPVASNSVYVSWLGVTLASDSPAVGAGHPITFTARSTIDIASSGHVLQIYDDTAKKMLTYCTRGTTCSTSYELTNGASHSIVAYLSGTPDARSALVRATWLSLALNASTVGAAGETYLKATTNTDLSTTPWSVAIYDAHGSQVAMCKTGYICTGSSNVANAPFTAAVGLAEEPNLAGQLGSVVDSANTSVPLTNIQLRSSAVEPARIIWGVDSCKAMTADVGGEHNLYANTSGHLGAPDFWGRYLTDTICPGISSAEVAMAHGLGLGILPIYNDYDCSAVAGYDTGYSYGVAATDAAAGLGIPAGRAVAVDIEPPGPACPGAGSVDSSFIQGWYDAVTGAHYAPAYYGNGTDGSEFATAWCAAVSPDGGRPEIAAQSFLWSFEPSFINAGAKGSSPGFAAYSPGCAGNTVAWQYLIDTGPTQDVDLDEFLTSMPLWYP